VSGRRGGEKRGKEGGRKGKGEDDCYFKLFLGPGPPPVRLLPPFPPPPPSDNCVIRLVNAVKIVELLYVSTGI